jgi:hypothetical protein
MTLMDTVCVVEAEYAAVIGSEPMGQKEGKIVENDKILFVNPNLFAHNTGSARTPKLSFVIRSLV